MIALVRAVPDRTPERLILLDEQSNALGSARVLCRQSLKNRDFLADHSQQILWRAGRPAGLAPPVKHRSRQRQAFLQVGHAGNRGVQADNRQWRQL